MPTEMTSYKERQRMIFQYSCLLAMEMSKKEVQHGDKMLW